MGLFFDPELVLVGFEVTVKARFRDIPISQFLIVAACVLIHSF